MTTISVEFPFNVGSVSAPLRVAREVLGTQYQMSCDGMLVQVTLPRREDDFLSWRPFVPGGYRALLDWGKGDEVAVYVILVTVEVEADVTTAAPLEGEMLTRASNAVDKARRAGEQVVAAFVAWVRATTRMTELALSSEVPSLAGPARAVDAETGRRLNVGPSLNIVAVARDPAGKYRLAATDMEEIFQRVRRDQEAPVAETLLADAEYYANHGVNDLRRAVLMAAIACEVKVKEVLRGRASDVQKTLVDFALDNPREIALTAAGGLFDKLMLATLGQSLKRDDKMLFQNIVLLYEVRNRIAHRGTMPDTAEARRVVNAARRCFMWLDNLPVSQVDGP
jgi:hypothetical protein